jgi:hypothetical protein
MGRCVRLLTTRLFWLWLLNLYAALLVGLALVNLAPLPSAGTAADRALRTRTPTPAATSTLPPTLTPAATLHAGAVTGVHRANAPASSAPSWLGEVMALAIFIVVGFGLIMFPIAVRSARIDKRTLPAYPLPPAAKEKQVARLSRAAPVRKEPLTREQLQALRDAALGGAAVSQQSAGALATIRLVDGVPVSLPSSEAGTSAQLPMPRQPVVTRVIESNAGEEAAADQD